jgi:hypothetical protein
MPMPVIEAFCVQITKYRIYIRIWVFPRSIYPIDDTLFIQFNLNFTDSTIELFKVDFL